jgi:hypothetical protein
MNRILLIVLHPLFIVLLFCGLIIYGEEMASFYISILMLGLPYGIMHAIVGVVGIALLVIGMILPKKTIPSIVNLLGALCLIISLYRFFTQPGASYNYNTFRALVPLILIIVFAFLITLFIIKQLRILVRNNRSNLSGSR